MAKNTLVVLKVYNALGQEVETLVNEERMPGSYAVRFDPSTSSGRALPSGVYFYRLTAGSFVETKRMILLK